MTPLDQGSNIHKDLYLTTHTVYKRQTSMHPAGIEREITAKRAAADLRLRSTGHRDRRFRTAIFILRHTLLFCVKIQFIMGSADVSESSIL